jgi:membrane-associated phospholipid phosphatase
MRSNSRPHRTRLASGGSLDAIAKRPGRGRAKQARPWLLMAAARLIVGAAATWAVLSAIGLILTHVLDKGPVHSADLGVDVWFVHHRTRTWDSIMRFGTDMARTETVVVVAAVAALLLRWLLGRWRESLILIVAVAGEVLIFLAVTATVPQRRPPVPKLQVAPPTSSFPSGHTGASVALYGCIAILLLANYGRHPAVRAAAAVLFCIPVFVGTSRLYEGEHYPSDVLAGALLASLWLTVVLHAIPIRTVRAVTEGSVAPVPGGA